MVWHLYKSIRTDQAARSLPQCPPCPITSLFLERCFLSLQSYAFKDFEYFKLQSCSLVCFLQLSLKEEMKRSPRPGRESLLISPFMVLWFPFHDFIGFSRSLWSEWSRECFQSPTGGSWGTDGGGVFSGEQAHVRRCPRPPTSDCCYHPEPSARALLLQLLSRGGRVSQGTGISVLFAAWLEGRAGSEKLLNQLRR